MSLNTQQKIASVFKQEVLAVGFKQVSISNLMKKCQLRRQTFYDYFSDKYALLTWQLNATLTEVIDDNLDYLEWRDILRLFIYEIDANRKYYYECVCAQHEIDITDTFAMHLLVLFAPVVKQKATQAQTKANLWLLCLGIAYSLIHNILDPRPIDYELIVNQAIAAIEFSFIA